MPSLAPAGTDVKSLQRHDCRTPDVPQTSRERELAADNAAMKARMDADEARREKRRGKV